MIDSHAHLIWDSFEVDRPLMMERARAAGVQAFIHPCVHTRDLPKMQALKVQFGNIFLAAGVHPCHAHEWTDQSEVDIEKFKAELFAIGETGLDYYHLDCPIEIQKEVFRKQCRLAKALNLPLIVHCRDAFEDTLTILQEENPGAGVMHCYTGTAEFSARFWELGFYTSFAGCLTFKKANDLREEAKKIPLARTLIETDCPFLAPQKYRGQRNEPSFIVEVADNLSVIHDSPIEQIKEQTAQNTLNLFKIGELRNEKSFNL